MRVGLVCNPQGLGDCLAAARNKIYLHCPSGSPPPLTNSPTSRPLHFCRLLRSSCASNPSNTPVQAFHYLAPRRNLHLILPPATPASPHHKMNATRALAHRQPMIRFLGKRSTPQSTFNRRILLDRTSNMAFQRLTTPRTSTLPLP